MSSPNFCACLRMCEIKQTFTYSGTPILSLSVRYPEAALPHSPFAQKSIHCRVQEQVSRFCRYVSHDLYRMAAADHQNSLENGFPFHLYEAVLDYTVTYNQHCHLSLYRDQYTYTGGAHGSTVRASDTWSLESGRRIPLSCFFPNNQDYPAQLIRLLTKQANEKNQRNPGIFFDNYPDLIAESFHEEQYYLTPSGIDLYYQQYDIAPYSTGIVVFTIPYTALNRRPCCCRM